MKKRRTWNKYDTTTYSIEILDWDVSYSLQLTGDMKDMPWPFWDHARLEVKGKFLAPKELESRNIEEGKDEMVIDPAIANRFINEYKRFLLAIYQPERTSAEPKRTIEKLASARRRFISNRGLLDDYISTLEDGTEPIDRKMMLAIRNVEFSRWVYLRDLKSYSIFLKDGGGSGYGVLGLTDEINDICGGAGVVLEAGVVALDNHYVCDGLIASLIHLGPNYRRNFNDLYKNQRASGRFLTNPILCRLRPLLREAAAHEGNNLAP